MNLDQSRMLEQAKFTYSLLGKAFDKQTKMMENQGERQRKAFEEHGKQLLEFNALIKKDDYNAEKDSPTLLKRKKYLINLLGGIKYQN